MTDDEYIRFLTALAGKHLRYMQIMPILPDVPQFSNILHILRAVRDSEDPIFLTRLRDELENSSVVRDAVDQMWRTGILDALDYAPDLVLGELRRSALPREEEEILRRAGFDANEIEVLLTISIHRSHALALSGKLPSDLAEEAVVGLQTGLMALTYSAPAVPTKKKRKILNGIGKLLAGAAAGLGNALLVAGTIAAPNPATGYAAIASGGVAMGSFFAGLGDLSGE